MHFKIGEGSSILLGCTFDAAKNFELGNNSVINSGVRIDTRGGIIIGDNVSISNDVVILTADHDLNSPYFEGREKKVVINNFAFIGTRAMVMPGIIIYEGGVLAAGSIATKNIEPFVINAGIPARKIKNRSVNLDYKLSYRRLFH